MNKPKLNLKNVFDQLSYVENVDDLLKDAGLDPDEIVNTGITRLESIRSMSSSRNTVLALIKAKIAESLSSEAKVAMESLKELVPSMNEQQLNAVFSGLNAPELEKNESDMLNELKSDIEFQNLIRKHRSRGKK